jgi:hypothetical protein
MIWTVHIQQSRARQQAVFVGQDFHPAGRFFNRPLVEEQPVQEGDEIGVQPAKQSHNMSPLSTTAERVLNLAACFGSVC